MDAQHKRAWLTASIAGLVAAVGSLGLAQQAQAVEEGNVHCYGINKCQGTGECGGKGHGCAGKNECAGQGWIELPEDTCLKIQGGRLTPEEEG